MVAFFKFLIVVIVTNENKDSSYVDFWAIEIRGIFKYLISVGEKIKYVLSSKGIANVPGFCTKCFIDSLVNLYVYISATTEQQILWIQHNSKNIDFAFQNDLM